MDFSKIILALKGAKWYLVLTFFLAFALYIFKEPVGRLLDKKAEELLGDVPQRINRDLLVNELLEDLMYMRAANRAYIFRFHNGQNYFDGAHKLRMSCEYEVVSQGIERQAQNLKDIPTSLYPEFISEVIEWRMFYEDVNMITDLTTRVTLKRQGIESIAAAPYFDSNGNLIAIIGVDYVGAKVDKSLIIERQKGVVNEWSDADQITRFRDAVNSIGKAMLSTSF